MPSFMVAIKVDDATAAVASLKASAQVEPAIEAPLWPSFNDDDSVPVHCFVIAIAESESAEAAASLSEQAISGGVALDSRPIASGSQHDAGEPAR
jgi:hypothetical protein